MTTAAETIAFQAETKELLSLVIHSLYAHREIFLRELISNASDALDKLHFESLTNSDLDASDLTIGIAVDPEARILSVTDSGVGMSRAEVIENIGTIARSGTRRFLQALQETREGGTPAPELIGQFGVGFYSAFMVADEVVVETRRAGEVTGTRWSSRAEGDYTLEECERERPGTTVVLNLKEETDEETVDFTSEKVVREIVKRYSDFIEYPIEMEIGEGDERKVERLNSTKPLWTRPRSEIEDEEYAEFYRHLSHDWNEPLETIHFRAEGTTEYTALLYVPRVRPMDLFDPTQSGSRLHLYVKRVFVMDDCEELLPPYLRFVRGVVDAIDLPLNVSRETLQKNRRMAGIRKHLTRRLLTALKSILDERREDYRAFWQAFGGIFKEGLYHDDERREELARLALFQGSREDEPVTLPEYVERMPVKQQEIYVLCAPDAEAARRSPHLEAFREKGYEVLFFTDPVDEFVLQRLTEVEGHALRRIERGEVDLDEEGESDEREAREKELDGLLEGVRKELAESVEEVRFSRRLTESPAVLVGGEHDLAPSMRRVLEEAGQSVPPPRRVLELNATHPLVERLGSLSEGDAEHARFGEYCELILGQALIAEGGSPPDPERFARLLTSLMLSAPG